MVGKYLDMDISEDDETAYYREIESHETLGVTTGDNTIPENENDENEYTRDIESTKTPGVTKDTTVMEDLD